MTFYAIELDTCPAFGWEAGPNADIDIKGLRNKHERRNWPDGVLPHTFSLRFQNVTNADHLEDVKSMFMVMHGPHHSFLCKDYGDFRHGFKSNNWAAMPFAVGDGSTTEFQLTKTYRKGVALLGDAAPSLVRDIIKPVASTVQIYVNGVLQEGSGVVDVNPLTGVVTFAIAPADDAVISWIGEFRVPVRFSNFYLGSTIDNRNSDDYIVNGGCTLQEVFGE